MCLIFEDNSGKDSGSNLLWSVPSQGLCKVWIPIHQCCHTYLAYHTPVNDQIFAKESYLIMYDAMVTINSNKIGFINI